MDIQSRKIEFIQEFLQLQSEAAIAKLEKLLRKESAAEDSRFNPMSIEEYETRVKISIEDSKNGRMISAEDLLTEVRQWG